MENEKKNPADVKPEEVKKENPADVQPEATGPVDVQERVGLEPRSKKLYSEEIVEKNKLDIKTIKNITGTILIISDLRTEIDPDGLALQPNEEMDITIHFEPKEINRSRRLKEAVDNKYIAVIERPSMPGKVAEVPDVAVKNLHPDGDIWTAPYNELDKKYEEVLANEEKMNKRQSQEARRNRDVK